MQGRLVQNKYKITLANRRAFEPIRPIEAHVQLLCFPLQLIASEAVDLQSVRVIQPFLARKDHETNDHAQNPAAGISKFPTGEDSSFRLLLHLAHG